MEFLETASSIVYIMMMMMMIVTMFSSRKCRLDGRDNKLVVWCSFCYTGFISQVTMYAQLYLYIYIEKVLDTVH